MSEQALGISHSNLCTLAGGAYPSLILGQASINHSRTSGDNIE